MDYYEVVIRIVTIRGKSKSLLDKTFALASSVRFVSQRVKEFRRNQDARGEFESRKILGGGGHRQIYLGLKSSIECPQAGNRASAWVSHRA